MALVARPLATRNREVADCLAGDAVGNAVAVTGPPVAGVKQVATVDVGAGTSALGVIVDKPTATRCVVQTSGEVGGYSGLTPGQVYWVASTGAPGAPPAPSVGKPVVYLQALGVAVSADTLYLRPDTSMVVRVL